MPPSISSSSPSKKRSGTIDGHSEKQSKKHKKQHESHSTDKSSSGSLKSGEAVLQWKGKDHEKIGGVLVDCPSFDPPKYLSLYHQPSHASSSSSSIPELNDSLLVGTRPANAPKVTIESNNWDLAGIPPANTSQIDHAKGYPGHYLVALFDPTTKEVELYPAPLLTLSRILVPAAGEDGTRIQSNWQTARRDLGEAFGNRKQKLAMRNADRMKVDTTSMEEGVLQGISDSVLVKPKEEEATAANGEASGSGSGDLASRPIPLPHLDASSPEQVYPLSQLFPSNIASSINTSALLHANDADHIKKLLPSPTSRSDWLAGRIWNRVLSSRRTEEDSSAPSGSSGILKTSSSHQRQQLRLLLFVAYLWSLRSIAVSSRSKGLQDRKALKDRLKLSNGGSEAESLLDGLLSRFTERDRNSKKIFLTPFLETKLLATSLACCLHLDGFALEVELIAQDLGLPPGKIKELMKSLGCTTRYRTMDQQGAAGSTGGGKQGKKVMVLKCPVTLPEGGKGGPPPRGR